MVIHINQMWTSTIATIATATLSTAEAQAELDAITSISAALSSAALEASAVKALALMILVIASGLACASAVERVVVLLQRMWASTFGHPYSPR